MHGIPGEVMNIHTVIESKNHACKSLNLKFKVKERKEKDRKDGGKAEREGGKIEEGRKRNSESVYMSMSECKLKCC